MGSKKKQWARLTGTEYHPSKIRRANSKRKLGEVLYLQDILQLVADVNVLLIVIHLRVVGDQGVLRADVDGVINLPVDISDLASWME